MIQMHTQARPHTFHWITEPLIVLHLHCIQPHTQTMRAHAAHTRSIYIYDQPPDLNHLQAQRFSALKMPFHSSFVWLEPVFFLFFFTLHLTHRHARGTLNDPHLTLIGFGRNCNPGWHSPIGAARLGSKWECLYTCWSAAPMHQRCLMKCWFL